MQVDPIKPTFKAPGFNRVKLKYVKPLSNVGFKFNLRRCTKELGGGGTARINVYYTTGTVGTALQHPPPHQGTTQMFRSAADMRVLEAGLIKLSVGSGIDDMVPNPVRPIRTVISRISPTDSPTV